MTKNKILYIHLGYPKTGTTYIQNNLFLEYKFDNLFYLGKLDKKQYSNKYFFDEILIEKLIYGSSNFNNFDEQIKKSFVNQKKNLFLSEERFLQESMSFIEFSRMRKLLNPPLTFFPDYRKVALNIKKFSEVIEMPIKLIFTIRRQDELLHSWFCQKYYSFKKEKIYTFKDFLTYLFEKSKGEFILDVIDFNETIDFYKKVFGNSQISILVYEDLLKNKEIFLQNLFDVLDEKYIDCVEKNEIKINKLSINSHTKILRNKGFPEIKQKIFKKYFNRNLYTSKIEDEDRKLILEYFNNSNYYLSKKNNLNLHKYDYFKDLN